MSAIIRLFTPEGFVVAADGRMPASSTGEIGSDQVQKITLLRRRPSAVIGSIAGIAQLDLGNGEILDLRAVLSGAASAVERRSPADLYTYSSLIVGEIASLVRDFTSESIPFSKDAAGTSIFLDGLFPSKVPSQDTISITYGQTGTQINHELTPIQTKRAYCSKVIWDLLFSNGVIAPKWISRYSTVCRGHKMRTLADAVDVAVAIIKAHCEPEALTLDPDACRSIGGRIHIATLTPGSGCEWVRGFEPK